MTTDEWEDLLAGTTPGPWKVYNEDSIMVLGADDTVAILDLDERYLNHNLKDVEVAAAAPTSVAEVVRLRRAITDLRDSWAAPDDPADDYGCGMEAAYQIAATALTRILEGEV